MGEYSSEREANLCSVLFDGQLTSSFEIFENIVLCFVYSIWAWELLAI